MKFRHIKPVLPIRALALVGILLTVGNLPAAAPKDTVHAGSARSASAPREILFFMNPNGHPCQMQLAILDRIKDSLTNLATIRYYKTTNDEDYDAFTKYGIRGLPSLVIADQKGVEISRFTPGIQNAETILNALRAKKPVQNGKQE
jgi:thiol-disulfide isomerase/thioredoxin